MDDDLLCCLKWPGPVITSNRSVSVLIKILVIYNKS